MSAKKTRPYIVLVISLLFTLLAGAYAFRHSAEQEHLIFEQLADVQQARLLQGLTSRVALLRSIAGRIASRSDVTPDEFRTFVSLQGITESYPDVKAIAYAIPQAGLHPWQVAMLYVEPATSPTASINGRIFSGPSLRSVLEVARDTGRPAISGRLSLDPDDPEFLVALPLYALGVSVDDTRGRRAAFAGLIFSLIRLDRFIQGSIGANVRSELTLEIFNGRASRPDNLLYPAASAMTGQSRFTATRSMDVPGGVWTMIFSAAPGFRGDDLQLFYILVSSGILVSLVLFRATRSEAAAHSIAIDRAKQLRQSEEARELLHEELNQHRAIFTGRMSQIPGDVTAPHLAEEKLRDKEAKLQIALSDAGMPSWHWDLGSGNVTWGDEYLTWTDFVKRIHADDQDSVRLAVDRALQEQHDLDLEFRVTHLNGDVRWITLKGKVFRGDDGRPASITGVTIDITERRKDAEALRASEERYRLAARATNDVIWDWDLSSGHVQWNDALRTLFGYTSEQVEPHIRWRNDRVHPDDRERVESGLQAVIEAGGRFWSDEYRFRDADGTYSNVTDRAYIEQNACGQAVRVIAAITDVTRLKQAENEREQLLRLEHTARRQAEAASRLKDEFLATVSHELRTPLTPILGWVRMLRSQNLNPSEIEKCLGVIERNVQTQGRLIDDLLDVSRIITGKMQLKLKNVRIESVIHSAVDAVQAAADSKGVCIEVSVDPSLNEITADPDRLQQVMWNLLSNAVKFTPGGGFVRVTAARIGSDICLVVADNGIGIEPEFLPRVFDRFTQANGTSVRTFGGLGIGLAIVRYIVELHGGYVTAESPGKGLGSTFSVAIPARPAITKRRRKSQRPPASSSLKGLRVLVVDDEQDLRELMSTILEYEGTVVTTASSASEALAILRVNPPDLLISDIAMPGEDGYELLTRLREIEHEQQRPQVPAIALSAYARDADRQRSLQIGFETHIAKPVDPQELISLILEVVTKTSGPAG